MNEWEYQKRNYPDLDDLSALQLALKGELETVTVFRHPITAMSKAGLIKAFAIGPGYSAWEITHKGIERLKELEATTS